MGGSGNDSSALIELLLCEKNRSVKLPFLTKNSKHLGQTSAHDSSPLIEFTSLSVKNKGVKLPFVTKNKNISFHLHTRTTELSLPLILYTLKMFQI